jgi:hypothetical protein
MRKGKNRANMTEEKPCAPSRQTHITCAKSYESLTFPRQILPQFNFWLTLPAFGLVAIQALCISA